MTGNLTEEGIIHVPGMLSRYVRLGDGQRCHYMTAGETGPNVVLLHGGIPGSSGTAGFRFTAAVLGAAGFRVYCPDQPAFGLSDNREQYWPRNGTLDHVDFVERFAEALCLDKFHISGNSMGCVNAAHYIVRYPHRILSYALVAGFVGDHVPFNSGSMAGELAAPPSPPETIEDMRKMMQTIISKDAVISDDLLQMRLSAAKRNADAWNVWWNAVPVGAVSEDVKLTLSTKDRIDKLSMPGIYVYGVDDVICPVELGYQQEDRLPNIQFFYPENCGHQGQTDRPDLFNPLFIEFFKNGKVTRKTADAAGVSKRRAEIPALVEQK